MIIFFSLFAVVALWLQLYVDMSIITRLILIGLVLIPVWLFHTIGHPYVFCSYCRRGRTWDAAEEHFAEECRGGLFKMSNCGGTGKKLRWEVKVLQLFGFTKQYPDPVKERRHG